MFYVLCFDALLSVYVNDVVHDNLVDTVAKELRLINFCILRNLCHSSQQF